MRKAAFFLVFLSVVIFSCKNNKQKLVGQWHSVRLENADIDSFFVKSQQYIDTIGKNNDPATNMAVYGTTNMDSLRTLMQEQYDSAKSMQMRSVTNTIFRFAKDSLLFISFNGNDDTCKWYIDAKNKIQVEDLMKGGTGEKMTWELLELTDTSLVLRIPQDSTFSKVTFHPEKP